MTREKPTESLDGQQCPSCSQATLSLSLIDYQVETPYEPAFLVPGVWVDRCPACGEMVFPPESTARIEQAIAERTEQLDPSELARIRKELGVDQTEMSEVLGLGGRTYHRWEKGTQYPSRSMCYYIRVLAQFPDAFAWLRRREWRPSANVIRLPLTMNLASSFPDLARQTQAGQAVGKVPIIRPSFNPARALSRVAFG